MTHFDNLLASARSDDRGDRLDSDGVLSADPKYAVQYTTMFGGPNEFVTLIWSSREYFDDAEDPEDGWYIWSWGGDSEVRYISPYDARVIYRAMMRSDGD